MTFSLSNKSLQKLQGVHIDLVNVVKRAIQLTPIDFTILHGMRTLEEEKNYVSQGKSQTLDSRHLYGLAVDLGAWVDGQVNFKDKYYTPIADAMLKAAAELKVPLVWGGSWKTLKDLGHFELNRNFYPNPKETPCHST